MKMVASRDVVVVLPWVPATATPVLRRMSSASISARGIIGTPLARASTSSGLSSRTAVERTTTCASRTFSRACPACTVAPRDSSLWATCPLTRSEPETS